MKVFTLYQSSEALDCPGIRADQNSNLYLSPLLAISTIRSKLVSPVALDIPSTISHGRGIIVSAGVKVPSSFKEYHFKADSLFAFTSRLAFSQKVLLT